MKRANKIASFATIVCLIACATIYLTANAKQPSRRTSKPKYTLIMQDDFNGDSLNSKYWTKMTRNNNVPWKKWQSTHPSLFDVSNGRLRLYGRVNDGIDPSDTARYILSGIESQHKVYIKYGKVEVRARMNKVEGCVPAIWMSQEHYLPYPDYAEIDLVEHIGTSNTISQTVHTNYIDKLGKKDYPKHQVNPTYDVTRYNVYGIEILPDKLIFTMNGTTTHVYPKIKTSEEGQYPFGLDEMFLKLNIEAGYNKWLQHVDFDNFPIYMDIDWVKFYKLNE